MRAKEFLVVHISEKGTARAVASVEAVSKGEAQKAVHPISKAIKVPGIQLQVVDTEQVLFFKVSNGRVGRAD